MKERQFSGNSNRIFLVNKARSCRRTGVYMINRMGRVKKAGTVDFVEKELKSPVGTQVLVKIKASCICGSDLHIFRGRHPSVSLPVTIGHEFTGEVIAVGEAVTDFQKGDRVVVEPSLPCGTCEACRHGEYSYCENLLFTYRVGDGAMADYFIGSQEHMFRLPDKVSYEKGALTEPLAVAVHACKRAEIGLGDRVLVIGAGAIGIMIAAVCRKAGAAEVVISDLSTSRLAMAEKLGATHIVNAGKEDLKLEVGKWSGEKGFDKAFECVGAEATFRQAMELVKMNGLVTDVGIFEKTEIQLDASLFVKKELRVQGAQGYCPDAIQILQELPFEQMITHHFQLEELREALETASDPNSNAIKVCINI
jgi:2-desacetyl-2-hydroxyethyl bacteriochlorophyllide A dehydrogenase